LSCCKSRFVEEKGEKRKRDCLRKVVHVSKVEQEVEADSVTRLLILIEDQEISGSAPVEFKSSLRVLCDNLSPFCFRW